MTSAAFRPLGRRRLGAQAQAQAQVRPRRCPAARRDPSCALLASKLEACRKNGEEKRFFIWSTCDHADNYREVGAQSISYSTGVPVITAARLLANGAWNPGTMVNMEELDPDPFLALMPETGIGWQVAELPLDGSWPWAG